jgi:mRNA-degrading endonuclease RelE of RelBE toxin-antitoxin system
MSKWTVITKLKTKKALIKLPKKIQEAFEALIFDLSSNGIKIMEIYYVGSREKAPY